MKNTILFASILLIGLTACEQGPAERLGENIDGAFDSVGNAVEESCEAVTNEPC